MIHIYHENVIVAETCAVYHGIDVCRSRCLSNCEIICYINHWKCEMKIVKWTVWLVLTECRESRVYLGIGWSEYVLNSGQWVSPVCWIAEVWDERVNMQKQENDILMDYVNRNYGNLQVSCTKMFPKHIQIQSRWAVQILPWWDRYTTNSWHSPGKRSLDLPYA